MSASCTVGPAVSAGNGRLQCCDTIELMPTSCHLCDGKSVAGHESDSFSSATARVSDLWTTPMAMVTDFRGGGSCYIYSILAKPMMLGIKHEP